MQWNRRGAMEQSISINTTIVVSILIRGEEFLLLPSSGKKIKEGVDIRDGCNV